MTQYQDLIDKVRAAKGPDRELDGSIWWWVHLKPEQRLYEDRFGTVASAIKSYGNAGAALNQFFDSSNPYCLARRAFKAEYTASIDAALALVERCLPGWTWMLDRHADCTFVLWRDKTLRATVSEDGPTAPLAILLALLTALQSNEATNVEDK